MEKKKVIGFYDYTVILTYLGMMIAFTGIIKVLNEQYINGIICLMLAGICDMFDGAVASTKERNGYEKHFGIQIDSLSDLISFGVLPAIFSYKISGEKGSIGILVGIYVLCGLIRLAYYNVQEFERQRTTNEKRDVFLGVPITTSAIVLPLIYLIYDRFSFIGTTIFPVAMALLGIGFITGLEIKKPNKVGKLIIIALGLVEIIGVFLLAGGSIL